MCKFIELTLHRTFFKQSSSVLVNFELNQQAQRKQKQNQKKASPHLWRLKPWNGYDSVLTVGRGTTMSFGHKMIQIEPIRGSSRIWFKRQGQTAHLN